MQFAFFTRLIANMATILINFQQKFTLVRSLVRNILKFALVRNIAAKYR